MKDARTRVTVSIPRQWLELRRGAEVLLCCAVSTARNGAGERQDSECTPRGLHEIDVKIGDGCVVNTVFVGRQSIGEVYSPALRSRFPERDWIITRILWLRGLEPGVNCGGGVDSKSRCIYIHGAPDDVPMGEPGSRGCIRMRNADVLTLFDLVEVGTPVLIEES
ncbi:MAG: L,D-transpeptidase family protein [Chromatiales bacterium]